APSIPTTSLPKWRPSATSERVPKLVPMATRQKAARAVSALRASPIPVAAAAHDGEPAMRPELAHLDGGGELRGRCPARADDTHGDPQRMPRIALQPC